MQLIKLQINVRMRILKGLIALDHHSVFHLKKEEFNCFLINVLANWPRAWN